MRRKVIYLVTFLIYSLFSCGKYENDSVFEPTTQNKPIVINESYEPNGDFITFKGAITKSGNSDLLRYGHLWGDNQTLDFINRQYEDSSVTIVSSFQLDPISFSSETNNFNKDKTLYFIAFAINEAGISYSDVGQVYPLLTFDRYLIIQEQNNDNKINPGEKVKLRFYFKNETPINSVGTKVSVITNSSSYITSIYPLQNIALSPDKVTNSNEAFFDTEITIDGNTPNINLPVPVALVDMNGRNTIFSGNKIQIKIN